MSTVTFGSLFAGIGGFDLGFERAGMVCRWQVEIDDHCNEVLAHRWPDVKRLEDVNDVGRRNLEPVDVICGGFPCQDLSVAGKREGLSGERSGLWFQFHRVLAELAPRWVVVENVPGLLSSNGGRDLAVLLRGLVELRYRVCWRVLDAQYFGVAQRRRRVFIIGHLGDGRAAEVLLESQSGAWDTPPSREAGPRFAFYPTGGTRSCCEAREVSPALKIGSGLEIPSVPATFQETGKGWWNESETGGTLRERDFKDASPNLVAYGFSQESDGSTVRNAEDVSRPITGRHGDPGIVAYGVQTANSNMQGPEWKEEQAWTVQPHPTRTAVAFQLTGDRDDPNVSTYDDVHPTIPANPMSDRGAAIAFFQDSQYGAAHYDTAETLREGRLPHHQMLSGTFGVRRLTPTECERLQGFPDNFTAVNGMKDSPRYRMLGNAVAVPVAEWIGRRIVEVHEAEVRRDGNGD